MPEISRFYGIVIKMFFDDHAPPHFHAQYSGQEALIDIRTFAVISEDTLPLRGEGRVRGGRGEGWGEGQPLPAAWHRYRPSRSAMS